ncbi:hypothetical protein CDIF29631_04015 (plasmid) [Clostridioides difficile]|uniref:hypothetical protein n=1 Tax=Clostridioides difficile TaxID=1496 RepID=UPI001024DC09|nr:hypothetical protein [Clostridioides difficile]EGT5015215.1 hypothetical protein [Clostridioides difficile]MBS7775450.1 hypothetical protein [Clostridioides difficile]MDO0379145.1 hypothetical protein [Clostridioides difficile]VFF10400.1 Uncharacterised protein [Clostridioides difficile]HBE9615246.1 hypothetical protein [Clostridioides difficile]
MIIIDNENDFLKEMLKKGFDKFIEKEAWFSGYDENNSKEKIIEHFGTVKDMKMIFVTKLFGIITYDERLDIEFGKSIIEVMKSIQSRNNFDYIKNKKKYRQYILIANLLASNGWVEWGSSIRGAWFDAFGDARFPEGERYSIYEAFPIDDNDRSKNIDILLEYLQSNEI